MGSDKPTEGVSVKELEAFARKHKLEVFFCLSFIFACFFSFIFFSTAWSMIAATVGGILGILFPTKLEPISKKVFGFIFSQESVTQLVLGVLALVLSIVIPPLIFLVLGSHGGRHLYQQVLEAYSQKKM